MEDVVLALDLGTSSVKALAITVQGIVIAQASSRYPVLHPQPDHAEQETAAWWNATKTTIQSLTRRAEIGPRVAAIGVTGQMHGAVFLDDAQSALRPAIIWMDRRSTGDVEHISESVGRAKLTAIAGSRAATGFQAPTIHWIARHEPETWARTAWILTPKDWLRLKLTGEIATDPSDASGTLLFDVTRRQWSPELLATTGVQPGQLPPVRPSLAIGGLLRPSLARDVGLTPNLPVLVGAGDTPAAAIGAGIVSDATLMLSLSTGTQEYVPTPTPRIDPGGRIHTWCAALEPESGLPGWYQMGATLNGGAAIRWLAESGLGFTGPKAEREVFALATNSVPGAHGLMFVPYLVGERSPLFDPGARGAFIGLTDQHDRSDMARAVVEGITLAAGDSFAALQDSGSRPTSIVAVGGGAKSHTWLQIVADVFQLPLRPTAVADQSARGAGLVAAASLTGQPVAELAQQWTDLGPLIEPQPLLASLYGDRLRLLRQLHAAIRPHLGALS